MTKRDFIKTLFKFYQDFISVCYGGLVKLDKLKNSPNSATNRNITLGGMFDIFNFNFLKDYLENVQNVLDGNVEDQIKDGKVVGRIQLHLRTRRELSEMNILLNYKNAKEIIEKHGFFDGEGMVITVNIPDMIILSKGSRGSEILNFIKFSKEGYQIVAAIRINGFAIVTHFERLIGNHQRTRRTQHYLDSVMNRGSVIYFSGKTADLPLIVDGYQHPPSEP